MDYSAGTELFKYQWDYIHNPEGGWFVWEDSEEGAAFGGHISMTLNKTEFSDENRVNITTFIPGQTTSIAYHGNGGSGDGIPISIQPYFEPMEDNTANGFYAKVKVYTDDAETPHFEGEPKRIRKPLVGSGGLFRPNNAWEFTLPDQVGFYPDFKIEYYASLNEDGEYEKMEEGYGGRLYTTYSKSNTISNFDEKLLFFTCKQSEGLVIEQQVFESIWAKFRKLNLNTLHFGLNEEREIGYYHSGNSAVHNYEDLFLHYNGICNAFQKLLIESLRTQGLSASDRDIAYPNGEEFLVRAWKFKERGSNTDSNYPFRNVFNKSNYDPIVYSSGRYEWLIEPDVDRDIISSANLEGQNNKLPPIAHFFIHQVVQYNGRIYDPSYGKDFDSIDEWKSESIDGLFIRVEGRLNDGTIVNKWLIRNP